MAISQLYEEGIVRHVVSQNCDGLHLRSGLPKTAMSEVHGNMYVEVCKRCVPAREYVRTFDVTELTSTYKHTTGRRCYKCGEPLIDTIVHFGERGRLRWPLNWQGACQAANACDTILCLGSSLKVLKKYPWLWQMDRFHKRRPSLYIVNLQWTPKDKDATLKINGKCDVVMRLVMQHLGYEIPVYSRLNDPIFSIATPLNSAEFGTTTRPCLTQELDLKEADVSVSEVNLKHDLGDVVVDETSVKSELVPHLKCNGFVRLKGDRVDPSEHSSDDNYDSQGTCADPPIIVKEQRTNGLHKDLEHSMCYSKMPYENPKLSIDKHGGFYGTGLCIRSSRKEASSDDEDLESVEIMEVFDENCKDSESITSDGNYRFASSPELQVNNSLESVSDAENETLSFINLEPVKVEINSSEDEVRNSDGSFMLNPEVLDVKGVKVESFDLKDVGNFDGSVDAKNSLPSTTCFKAVEGDKQQGSNLYFDVSVKDLWFWGFNTSNQKEEKPVEDTQRRTTRSSSRLVPKRKCHCAGLNPVLCQNFEQVPKLPQDDHVLRARKVVARHRIQNYRRHEPVFEITLDQVTYERSKPKRKSKFEVIGDSEDENFDDEAIVEQDCPKLSSDVKDQDIKEDRKFTPGWYGKGYRKIIKKKTKLSL